MSLRRVLTNDDGDAPGALSLPIALPTMLVAFGRYSRDASFVVLQRNKTFVLLMAAGSIVGTLALGLLAVSISVNIDGCLSRRPFHRNSHPATLHR